jgi:hypothetical protein
MANLPASPCRPRAAGHRAHRTLCAHLDEGPRLFARRAPNDTLCEYKVSLAQGLPAQDPNPLGLYNEQMADCANEYTLRAGGAQQEKDAKGIDILLEPRLDISTMCRVLGYAD